MSWSNFSGFGGNGNGDDFGDAFDAFDNAPSEPTEPIPPGKYEVEVVQAKLDRARTGTPLYRVSFRVYDGQHKGRRLWRDFYLTDAAMPISKRELARLGITTSAELRRPLPVGLIALAVVGIEHDDRTGERRNIVVSATKLRIEPPAADPFAPQAEPIDAQ